MNKLLTYSLLLSLFLIGDVFITSEHFMNVENDAKAYYIGVLLIVKYVLPFDQDSSALSFIIRDNTIPSYDMNGNRVIEELVY